VKRFLRVTLTFFAVWLGFCGYMFWLMTRPIPEFTAGIARIPSFAMMVAPFPPMWNIARGGSLAVGDQAPDFDLETADRTSRARLSSNFGVRPVVLVFGSYT
jgi:hypothetical protein